MPHSRHACTPSKLRASPEPRIPTLPGTCTQSDHRTPLRIRWCTWDDNDRLRGGDHDVDQNDKVLFPQGLGLEACQEGWLQKGSRRRRQKAGGRSSCYVENKDPVPLERRCRLTRNRQHRPASNGASPPGRMARIRPTHRMPIATQVATRAWTTSADPPSDANMRRPSGRPRREL